MENIDNVVEAIIFSSGTPIQKSDIVEKVPELTTQKLNTIIKNLQKRYSDDCGILLLEFNGKLQFSSNPKYGETVADVLTPLKEKELTRTLLEVLSTIAYKQPITRLEIDDMRGGTNSEYAISGLLRAGLIEAVGRKDTVGRPLLYGTTDGFLKKFQLRDIDSLPDYAEVLEKLQIINADSSDSLFHNRSILDGEEGDSALVIGGMAIPVATDQSEQEAAADTDENKDDDIFSDDIPEFLVGKDFEVFD